MPSVYMFMWCICSDVWPRPEWDDWTTWVSGLVELPVTMEDAVWSVRPWPIRNHWRWRANHRSLVYILTVYSWNPLHQFPRSKSVTSWWLSRNKSTTLRSINDKSATSPIQVGAGKSLLCCIVSQISLQWLVLNSTQAYWNTVARWLKEIQ